MGASHVRRVCMLLWISVNLRYNLQIEILHVLLTRGDNMDATISKELVIMNFSHIYEEERFFQHEKVHWLDCTDMLGTDCYCADEAKEEIRNCIADIPVQGIHFIDSGNYHYVTEFWLEKIEAPFCLFVFDHHSDMEKPLFGDILSCGSWILDVLEHNEMIQKVVLLGISKEQEALIDPKFQEKLICIDEQEIKTQFFGKKLKAVHEEYPVYISIDKDVLTTEEIQTNWNQGSMHFGELKKILHILLSQCQVIGIDICGECTLTLDKLCDIENNSRFNEKLMEFLQIEASDNK